MTLTVTREAGVAKTRAKRSNVRIAAGLDGKISDNELARIDRECGELIASLHQVRESVARRNMAGKPACEVKA